MEKNDIKMQDEQIRKLFSGTKLKAGENLKYRIMQQIETESVLVGKKAVKNKSVMSLISSMVSVFGVMYGLIGLIAVAVFFSGGRSALESVTFLVPVIMVATVCVMFLMISVFDDKRISKHSAHRK